jgi:cysteinyl-tRNA synthetase
MQCSQSSFFFRRDSDGKALVKLVPPAELIKARDEKRAQQDAKAAKKAASIEEERRKRIAKLEKGRTPPQDMFRSSPEYGSFDDAGIPLTDAKGNELSKNQAKKVQKLWQEQEKLHQAYLEWQKTLSG